MKILVTGFTALQNGSENRQIYKIDVPAAFVDTLRKHDHDVEWRKVELYETDFGKYDVIIVCVAPITSSNSSQGLGALKALNRAKKAVIFYDDWKLKEVNASWKAVLKQGKKQFHKKWGNGMNFYKNPTEEIEANADELLAVVNDLFTKGRDSWKILCPMFEWGNKNIIFNQKSISFITEENFNYIDPTPAVINIDRSIGSGESKVKQWCIASIADHTLWIKKQHLKWPVNYYGCRKLKCERLKTEEDVFELYKLHWGVLSPEYPQSGSGWFRARFVYAAFAHSVLWCGKKDAQALGLSYKMEPSLIELHTDTELSELSDKQADELFKHFTTLDKFEEKLINILERW